MFSEREYQVTCEAAIFKQWETVQSTLIEMPTGCGKTIVFAKVIKSRRPGRALVLAHRNELIVQAKDKIESVTGLNVDIEKAELYASTSPFDRAPVVVSSIQTQNSGPQGSKRYKRFLPTDFSTLICDEAHHSASDSWKEVINYYKQNPNLKVLGVTATSDRADGEALGQVFESVAFQYSIRDAINDGWLVDPGQLYIKVKSLDFSHIKTMAGDLNEGELAKIMELEQNIQGVCQPTLEAIHGLDPHSLKDVPVPEWREHLQKKKKALRRTIVFTVSVAQAEMCANIFLRAMDGVEWVCGETNKVKRQDTLNRFLSGEINVVVNCGVLTEGYDNPWVELISVARPTKSRSLYCQMIGRATRTLPGVVDNIPTAALRIQAIAASAKPISRILDFVGNSGKHKLISSMDVLAGNVPEEVVELAKKIAIEKGTVKRVMKTLTNAEVELERRKQEAIEKARRQAEARKSHLVAKVQFTPQKVDPFGKNKNDPIPNALRASKDGKQFSEPQARALRMAGYDPNKLTFGHGKSLLGKLPPSEPQLKCLNKYGYDTTGWSRQKCSKMIQKLKDNGWKKVPVEEIT